MTEVTFRRGARFAVGQAFAAGARVVVVTSRGRAHVLDETLRAQAPAWDEAGRFVQAAQHVPRADFDAIVELADRVEADGVLAWGGGSVIGLAKALATRRSVRKVYVPTTYSGSEMTNIWAVSDPGGKVTARDDVTRADLVIYDADLLDDMPRSLVYVSLFNAMAHAVEALYAANATSEVLADAAEAVAVLSGALRRLADGDDRSVREAALRGAMLAGRSLDRAEMGIQHKLAHVLGGTLGLDHASVHTVLLPYSVWYNREWAPDAMAQLTAALGGDPVLALRELQRATQVPSSLAALGVAERQLARLLDDALARPYPNPRPVERASLRVLLAAALRGEIS